MTARICIFRDWGWDDEEGYSINNVRLAKVVRAESVPVPENLKRIVGFSNLMTGLKSLVLPQTDVRILPPQPLISEETVLAVGAKRKFAALALEIPDSDGDDEDYGWGEEDEQDLPPPPPQWQGSEDILVVREEEEMEEDAELDELGEDAGGGANGGGDVEGDGRAKKLKRQVVDDSEDELAYD